MKTGFLLQATLLLFACKNVLGLGLVEFRVDRFENRQGRLAEGECCTRACICRTRFRFCLYETNSQECTDEDYVDAGVIGGNIISFSPSILIQKNGTLNGLGVIIQASHDIRGGTPRLINEYVVDLSSLNVGRSVYSTGFQKLEAGTGLYPESGATLRINTRVYCAENFYGSQCSTYCLAEGGRYTCDPETGRKQCEYFYTGVDCREVSPCRSAPCLNGGTCVAEVTERGTDFRCICQRYYSGKTCKLGVDDCASNPCLNNGTCIDGIGTFSCTCPPGFTGNKCDLDVNECALNPCRNGSTCVNQRGSYLCFCPPGYTDQNCTTDINECEGEISPCQNGATCINTEGSFICQCAPGFRGSDCRTALNDCRLLSLSCLNEGECVVVDDRFQCRCPQGYSGERCESFVCNSSPCENGGSCSATASGFSCTCAPGFRGDRCEILAPCSTDPCQNGGQCRERGRDYECRCQEGYLGKNCENRDQCFSAPCLNGGTCRLQGSQFSCQCRQGYSGRRCQNYNACELSPCRNGATCRSQGSSYTCSGITFAIKATWS